MIDLHINHLCNAAELELQELGLSAESAHIAGGSIIRANILAFREYNK